MTMSDLADRLADQIEQSDGLVLMLYGGSTTSQLGIKKTAMIVAALRQAAKPVGEPVRWLYTSRDGYESYSPTKVVAAFGWRETPLYAQPQAPAAALETCKRCQGNGEIVTDWDKYKHPANAAEEESSVKECPNCDGEGKVEAPAAALPGREALVALEKYLDEETARSFSEMTKAKQDGDLDWEDKHRRVRDAYSDATMKVRELLSASSVGLQTPVTERAEAVRIDAEMMLGLRATLSTMKSSRWINQPMAVWSLDIERLEKAIATLAALSSCPVQTLESGT